MWGRERELGTYCSCMHHIIQGFLGIENIPNFLYSLMNDDVIVVWQADSVSLKELLYSMVVLCKQVCRFLKTLEDYVHHIMKQLQCRKNWPKQDARYDSLTHTNADIFCCKVRRIGNQSNQEICHFSFAIHVSVDE